ncbi:MAG: heme exporter protein CcmB [Deltaproteobacteria bacterium]|nr:heme exporter protein CcmB [Deltaproteobacteria bacterium]
MNSVGKIWIIVRKDLTLEFRSREMLFSMCLFSFLVLIIFAFAFEKGFRDINDLVPGIIWVAIVFSALMGLGRSFGAERDGETLSGLLLCPVSRWAIYLAKMIGTLLFTALMVAITLLVLTILYNQDLFPFLLPLGLIIFLGTLGFSTVGTLFSAMSATTNARHLILSILIFPISIPLIIAAVKATGFVLDGNPLSAILPWLKILIAFDSVFLLLSYLTFDFVMEE